MAKTKHTTADYFAEAMVVLAESGFPDLTAANLCSRLHVTRGSFYHHFASFEDFVSQFLTHWEERYSSDLIARSLSDDFTSQIEQQAELALGLPHAAEAALRAWGSVEPHVAEAQRRVDQLRHRGLADSLRSHGVPPERANLYATVALATLVGMQSMRRPLDAAELRRVYEELAAALLGQGSWTHQVSVGLGVDSQSNG